MAVIDYLIMVLMAASALVIYRNLSSEKLRLKVRGPREDFSINGRSVKPYVLFVEGDEALSEVKARRLSEVLASIGVDSAVVVTYFNVDRSHLLKMLEEEIKSVEFKYHTTRLPRYQARLEFLKGVYARVARLQSAIASTIHVIVFAGSDSELNVVKRSLEAELGVNVRVGSYEGLAPMISSARPVIGGSHRLPPPVRHDWGAKVIVGSRRSGGVAALSWPRDLEAHVGVFGPTGRGKTVLLAGLAAQLSTVPERPYSIIAVDPKGDLSKLLEPVADLVVRIRPGLQVAARSGPCIGSPLLQGLTVFDLSGVSEEEKNSIAIKILSSIVDHVVSGGAPGRVVIVVDEAWRISSASHLFKLIAREGRSKGLHMIYASQSPADMPRDILFNTRVFLVFGGSEASYLEAAASIGLSSDLLESLKDLETGEAVLKVGSAKGEVVRVLEFHEYLNRPGSAEAVAGGGGKLWVRG